MAKGRCSFKNCRESSAYGNNGYYREHSKKIMAQLNKLKRSLTERIRNYEKA